MKNEPAFPCNWHDFQPTTGDQVIREQYFGLTIRAYLASAAMKGLVANSGVIFGHHKCPEHPADCAGSIAKAAVEIADALIAELSQ